MVRLLYAAIIFLCVLFFSDRFPSERRFACRVPELRAVAGNHAESTFVNYTLTKPGARVPRIVKLVMFPP